MGRPEEGEKSQQFFHLAPSCACSLWQPLCNHAPDDAPDVQKFYQGLQGRRESWGARRKVRSHSRSMISRLAVPANTQIRTSQWFASMRISVHI